MKAVDSDRALQRRNFILNALEGATYIGSNGFAAVQTVIPAIVAGLGGSNLAVGAVQVAGFSFQFLPQIFAARYAEASPWKRTGTLRFGFIQRCVMIVMALVLFLLGGSYPWVALPVLLSLYAVNQAFSGLAGPYWFDFIAKVTPPHWRGRLIGIRTSSGGVFALIAGLMLTGILASVQFPASYALALALAGLMQFASLVIQARVIEATPSDVAPLHTVASYFQELPEIIRGSREFGRFILSMALLILGSMAVPFFPVYAVRELHAQDEMVGAYTTMMVVIQIGSALLTGFVADRFGNKRALIIAGSGLAMASLLAVVTDSPSAYLFVYLFLGINVGSEVMSRYNMAIDFAPEQRRSTFVGLVNTVLAPMYLAGILGGFISDMFGYRAVFLVSLFFSCAGIVVLAFLVKEPRAPAARHRAQAAA